MGSLLGAREIFSHQRLTKGDRSGFQNPTAIGAIRIFFTIGQALKHHRHSDPVAALQARNLAQRAMNLDHPLIGTAGQLVQAIDILGHQSVQTTALLESRQRIMARPRACLPYRRITPRQPGLAPDCRVADVITNIGEFFCVRVARPQSLRPTKIRNARGRGDTGAGQYHHSCGALQPDAYLLERRGCIVNADHSHRRRCIKAQN